MTPCFETIRKRYLDSIIDERVRITQSAFEANPEFENIYLDCITRRQDFFDIYQRWVVSNSIYPFSDNEAEWEMLRNSVFEFPDPADPNSKVNIPLVYFIVDMLLPFIEPLVIHALEYYRIDLESVKEEEIMNAIIKTAIGSLYISTPDEIKAEGYPFFMNSFIDKFKVLFMGELNVIHIEAPKDNKTFTKVFEDEWKRLLKHQDFMYGFEVVPLLGTDALIRYLKLPFNDKEHASLTKTPLYQQVMNYFTAIATFKPVPDNRIKIYYRQQLCEMFIPLARNIARRLHKEKSSDFSEDKLREIVQSEIRPMVNNFDYFFATANKLKKKTISPFKHLFIPLNGVLAKLGVLQQAGEYPITDYLVKKIESKMKTYFLKEDDTRYDNQETFDDIETSEVFDAIPGVTIDEIEEQQYEQRESRKSHMPEYDAQDEKGNIIGWRIKTFSGITGKSEDTLRRWDRKGYLKSVRFNIRSPRFKKIIPYRAYTRDDLTKIKGIDDIMEKRAKHQK